MNQFLTLFFILALFAACETPPVKPGDPNNPPVYTKADLQKLRWIEGNWKSEVMGAGYYQTYHFPTDSSLQITSYQFNGQDSSGTNISSVYWRNNHLYLGPNGEWVAVLLDKNVFQLAPVRSGWFYISWTKDPEKDEWTAVQQKPDFTRTIKMKRQPPLEELLKNKAATPSPTQ